MRTKALYHTWEMGCYVSMDIFSLLPDDAPVTSDEMRNDALVKRLRVLLHAFPLFALGQSDTRRDESLRHYDTLTIALKILDIVAERMGMEFEADREYVDFALSSLLEAMDRKAGLVPDKGRHLQIVDRVLAALKNDADARRLWKPIAQNPKRQYLGGTIVKDIANPSAFNAFKAYLFDRSCIYAQNLSALSKQNAIQIPDKNAESNTNID